MLSFLLHQSTSTYHYGIAPFNLPEFPEVNLPAVFIPFFHG